MIKCYLDYETQSEANLKKKGGYEYALHHSTDILCAAFKIGNDKTRLWVPKEEPPPSDLFDVMRDPGIQFRAHNAFFEQCITSLVFFMKYFGYSLKEALALMPPERWYCTAAKAAACALPRGLEGAALAIRLPIQKNMEGNRLMKKYMKPRPVWNKWKIDGGKVYDKALCSWFDIDEPQKYYDDEFELWDVQDYCVTDVGVMKLLDEALPDLSEEEYKTWVINQKMNFRGVAIDTKLAKKIVTFNTEEVSNLQKRLEVITGGDVTSATQTAKLLNYLQGDIDIDNMQADTLRNVLKTEELTPNTIEIIDIRLATSMTSNKKYSTMLERSKSDGRVRDLALYHGASTGRESGRGLQVHNLPKGKIKDTYQAVETIHDCNTLEDLKLYYSSPSKVFSSCIRSTITASEGYELFAADYNAIEARVVMWLANHDGGLNLFRQDKDPYIKMASRIFGRPEDTITPGERFLGKTAVLGCGYQMGAPRFYETCIEWGVPDVTKPLAKKAVEIYRDTHKPVVFLWANYEKAAIKAVRDRVRVRINKVVWYVKGKFLWCELPSGRRLAFYGPKVKNEPTPWGEIRPKLYYWKVDSKTKQWVHRATYGGHLTENICQAISRDITVNGIKNIEKAGYHYLFQVHDEIIAERLEHNGSLEEYIKLITDLPKWAKGLPVKADGWVGPRYKK